MYNINFNNSLENTFLSCLHAERQRSRVVAPIKPCFENERCHHQSRELRGIGESAVIYHMVAPMGLSDCFLHCKNSQKIRIAKIK